MNTKFPPPPLEPWLLPDAPPNERRTRRRKKALQVVSKEKAKRKRPAILKRQEVSVLEPPAAQEITQRDLVEYSIYRRRIHDDHEKLNARRRAIQALLLSGAKVEYGVHIARMLKITRRDGKQASRFQVP